jgi:nitrogenase molybdenum-iron protein alpha/beta subunit
MGKIDKDLFEKVAFHKLKFFNSISREAKITLLRFDNRNEQHSWMNQLEKVFAIPHTNVPKFYGATENNSLVFENSSQTLEKYILIRIPKEIFKLLSGF